MSLMRYGVTAIATATIVLGLGYIVQSDGTSDTRSVRKASQPTASAVYSVTSSTNTVGAAIFGMPRAIDAPAIHQFEGEAALIAVDARFSEMETPQASFMPASPLDSCETDLIAEPRFAAMVGLTLQSPCHPNADVVVWHEQMMFSARTDDVGDLALDVPALSSSATFVVTVDNIEEARTIVHVPDADMFDRAILQWRGTGNLQLHAMEFGATIGDPGHIWSASTHSPELAHDGERGFMTRLGTSNATIPYWAEVYTYPTGLVSRDGQIKLQVGAAVTEENCGRELDVKGIRTNAGRYLASSAFEIEMPGCDTVGQSFMRPDLFDTLTLAAR